MLDTLTENATRVMTLANGQARSRGDQPAVPIEPVHLLLGLLLHDRGVAAQVLCELGVDVADLRWEVEGILATPRPGLATTTAFTTGRSPALRSASREARRRRDVFIGTEHILLGLLRLGDDPAARGLGGRGVTLSQARQQVNRVRQQQAEASVADAPGRLLCDFAEQLQEVISEHERLGTEVVRLRRLLSSHGIDPDGHAHIA